MSALMEYGVFDELFSLLYSYDQLILEDVLIIMRKILEEVLENSENRNMILQKFEEFETVQRLQELRMNLFYDIAADNAFHILNLYEKIVFENLRGYYIF